MKWNLSKQVKNLQLRTAKVKHSPNSRQRSYYLFFLLLSVFSDDSYSQTGITNPFVGIWEVPGSGEVSAGLAFTDSTQFMWIGMGGGLPLQDLGTEVKYTYNKKYLFTYENGVKDSVLYTIRGNQLMFFMGKESVKYIKMTK